MTDPVLEALNRAAEEVTPADIDIVIDYLRKAKGQWDRGEKPKKNDAPGLDKLLNLPKPVKFSGTMRRI
jgi:hypothetical protein